MCGNWSMAYPHMRATLVASPTSMATSALPTSYWQLTSLVITSPGDRSSGALVRIERDADARETCLWSN